MTTTATRAPRTLTFNPLVPVPGVSFGRLLVVEARKLVNTRAGRWLMILSLLAGAGTLVASSLLIDDVSLLALFNLGTTPVAMLVPIVAILSATAEWSQRTGLATFALEPRRSRVVLAKLVVSALTGAAAVLAVLGMAAVTLLVANALGSNGTWNLSWQVFVGHLVIYVVSMLQASAIAFLLLNTPAAIVAYFLIPTVWTIMTTLSTWLAERAHWLDVGTAGLPLIQGNLSGTSWLHLAVAASIWVLLPMVVGIGRVLRTEIK